MEFFSEEIKDLKWKEIKELINIGLKYDDKNKELVKYNEQIEEMNSKDVEKRLEEFNSREFPPHIEGFVGPGNMDELAKGAIEYFNNNCKPNEHAIKASVREKEWYVFKRNIFGQIVQYGLTFFVAVIDDNDKEDVARMYSISFLTEENVNTQKSLPFTMSAFNQQWKMKRSKILN